MEGLVFSIEEFSTFNGPGIRATVFLKGCPLRCRWCHNPEGQRASDEILRSPAGCLHCGACAAHAVREKGRIRYTEESLLHCPNDLLRHSATRYSPEELEQKLDPLLPLLAPEGGVTFSGGEPLAQPGFLWETLRLLRGRTHRALQTSGWAEGEIFRRILAETDLVLYDLKLMDEAESVRWTGSSNRPILENFDRLAESGVPFCVRTPLIPTVTDTEENLAAVAAFLRERGIRRIELLPYNKMAGSKYALIGETYEPGFDETLPCRARTELFASYGIAAAVL